MGRTDALAHGSRTQMGSHPTTPRSATVDTVHMADVNQPKSGEVQRFADREKPINLRQTIRSRS